jgi:hypothetical protein
MKGRKGAKCIEEMFSLLTKYIIISVDMTLLLMVAPLFKPKE